MQGRIGKLYVICFGALATGIIVYIVLYAVPGYVFIQFGIEIVTMSHK